MNKICPDIINLISKYISNDMESLKSLLELSKLERTDRYQIEKTINKSKMNKVIISIPKSRMVFDYKYGQYINEHKPMDYIKEIINIRNLYRAKGKTPLHNPYIFNFVRDPQGR